MIYSVLVKFDQILIFMIQNLWV